MPHPQPRMHSGRGLASRRGSVAHRRQSQVLVDRDEAARTDARLRGHPCATRMHGMHAVRRGENQRTGQKPREQVRSDSGSQADPQPRSSCSSICASPPGCQSTAAATRLTSVGRRSVSRKDLECILMRNIGVARWLTPWTTGASKERSIRLSKELNAPGRLLPLANTFQVRLRPLTG